jgi:hypothetical protein
VILIFSYFKVSGGHIAVCDSGIQRVQVFDNNFGFVGSIPFSKGKRPKIDWIRGPVGVCLDDQYVYITDTLNHCVNRYEFLKLDGQSKPESKQVGLERGQLPNIPVVGLSQASSSSGAIFRRSPPPTKPAVAPFLSDALPGLKLKLSKYLY